MDKDKPSLADLIRAIQNPPQTKYKLPSLLDSITGKSNPQLSDLARRIVELQKHKVFISYYHHDDEYYRNRFETLFGTTFINKSVAPGEIDSDNSADYIKRLIQTEHITDSSVIVVLVGRNTWGRKHVDWEISAALSMKAGGYSGLLGLRLPTHPDYGSATLDPTFVPPRLVDNLDSGYASIYEWTEVISDMKSLIQDAFDARIDKKDLINNSSQQFQRNRN